MPYQNVIVGTDGSATAARAVVAAAEVARDHGARLVVVTAYEPQGDELVETAGAPDELKWMLTDRSQAEERARSGKAAAVEAGAPSITVQAVAGAPADVLLGTAEDFGADCIVVGSVGLTSAANRILGLGSVASAVAHHAACDVLIVHTS